MPTDNFNNVRDELGVAFPIKTMGDFLNFEEEIAESREKKEALVNKNIEITLLYTCYIITYLYF